MKLWCNKTKLYRAGIKLRPHWSHAGALKPIRRGRTFLSPNFVKFGYVINSRKLKTLYFAEIF